ncbi:MAG: hypothetical protein K6F69_10765 [Treponema sp.]|nr:hypothetical protein [Treponema sp.]
MKPYLEVFTVKDVVFLAIISAVTICSAAVMPIVAHIYIFGLAQLVTAFQYSFFPAIAIMKVRKVGTVLFIMLLSSLLELFMAPVMFFSSILTGFIIEILIFIFFKGYENEKAVFIAASIITPLTLPFNAIYYKLFSNEAWNLFFASGFKYVSLAVIAGVILVSMAGAFLGIKLSRELKKAGVIKK